MLMSKETATHIIIKHFGSFTDEIVTAKRNKRTGAITEVVEPLNKYSQLDYSADIKMIHLFELGNYLGFTWPEIYQAYKNKNAVNYERLKNGY